MATPVANSIGLSGNPYVDVILQGSSWQFGGGPHVLTYSLSINDSAPVTAWSGDFLTSIHQALDAWAAVANITFVESGSGGVFTASTADIAITLTGNNLSEIGAIGLGVFPDPAFADSTLGGIGYPRSIYPRPEGDIFFDNYSTLYFNYVTPGTSGFQILLHETGHALGLKHTDDDGGNARPTIFSLGISNGYGTEESIMGSGVPSGTPALTPMLYDILAIQTIYGANMSYHTGDDTYTPTRQTIQTIWDAGGTDTLDFSSYGFASTTISLEAGAVNGDQVPGQIAIAFGATIENAIAGSGNDTLLGNAAANTLTGGAGNDTIVGNAGSDTMIGGSGNDRFAVQDTGDVVIENPSEGNDTVFSFVDFTLGANVENLTLAGGGSINGSGNALANAIVGNAANNVLNGGAGLDLLSGGAGDDTYVIDDTASGGFLRVVGLNGEFQLPAGETRIVTSSVAAFSARSGDGNGDTLTDFVNISFVFDGLAYAVVLTAINRQPLVPGTFSGPGNSSADVLFEGHAGGQVSTFTIYDAQFDTSTGQVLSFYASFETLGFHGPGIRGEVAFSSSGMQPDVVMENAGEGTDSVRSSVTYALPAAVENLQLTGSGDINGTGNSLANVISGNSGVNVLSGAGGNDTYVVGAGDSIVELANDGTDSVQSSATFTLSANVENLTLTGSGNIDGTGNTMDNLIVGNSGTNVLTGGAGNDTYGVFNTASTVVENSNEGTDTIGSTVTYTLPANVEKLFLFGTSPISATGNTGDNEIRGNFGHNDLFGGGGNDTFDGGSGHDTLHLALNRADYTMANSGADRIFTNAGVTETVRGVETVQFADGTLSLHDVVMHFGDTNGDGKADLLWRNLDGSAAIWNMNGASVIAGGVIGPANTPLEWQMAGTGDFNGDGRQDMVWHNADGSTAIWTLSGSSLLGGGIAGPVIPTDWSLSGTGDFNGDGKDDLLWHNQDGSVAVWLMNNLTVIGGAVTGSAPTSWSIAGTGDFNGDHKEDIVWRNTDGSVAVWLMNGTAVAGGAVVGPPVPNDWRIEGTGDFNGDGKSDLLWRNNDGTVAVWLMNGANSVGGGVVGAPVPKEWVISGTGDFNGDHRDDIAWRNDDGSVAVWLLNGTSVLGGGIAGSAPTDWTIV